MSRKLVAVITAITQDRVIVDEDSLDKAFEHLNLPNDILLELLERVLKDPSNIFLEPANERKHYHLFYRWDRNRYFVAVVKRISTGAFLCTMHITGKRMRNVHLKLEKIK